MKKLLFLISLSLIGVSINAALPTTTKVRIINDTGLVLKGHASFVGCKDAELFSIGKGGGEFKSPCCFVGMTLTVVSTGQSKTVASERHAGVQMTCGSLTYVASIRNGQLDVRPQTQGGTFKETKK